MQGFGKKYRKPSGARMIFSTNPKGLALLLTGRTRITFACGYGDSATVCRFCRIMFLFRKIAAVYMAFSERNVIFASEIKSYLKA